MQQLLHIWAPAHGMHVSIKLVFLCAEVHCGRSATQRVSNPPTPPKKPTSSYWVYSSGSTILSAASSDGRKEQRSWLRTANKAPFSGDLSRFRPWRIPGGFDVDSWGGGRSKLVFAGRRVTAAPSPRRLPLIRLKDIWLSGSRFFWSGFSFLPMLPLVFILVVAAGIRPPESFNIGANLPIFCLAPLALRVIPQTRGNFTPGPDEAAVGPLSPFSFLSFTTEALPEGALEIEYLLPDGQEFACVFADLLCL